MVKIAAGICTYAEEQGLRKTLESLKPVERVFVVHGPFPHFGFIDSQSIDRTAAVCNDFDNVKLISFEDPMHENERRETYLKLMEDYDFCITIDSDEYVSDNPNWDLFRQNCQKVIDSQAPFFIYDIMFDGYPAQSGPRPRLFYQPPKIKYYKKHYWWILPDGRIAAGSSDSKKVVEGIHITHDKSHRSSDRHHAMWDHQRWLLQHDSQFILTSKERMC